MFKRLGFTLFPKRMDHGWAWLWSSPALSPLDTAIRDVADELRAHVPTVFDVDIQNRKGRLRLFYLGDDPEQYFVSPVFHDGTLMFAAEVDNRTDRSAADETCQRDLGKHATLLAAIETCLADQGERLLYLDVASEAKTAPEDSWSDDAAYLNLKARVDRAFSPAIDALTHLDPST